MKEVIGVRFRPNGKIYYFDPIDYHVQVGTDVIVETARGVEYGKCVLGRKAIEDEKRIAVSSLSSDLQMMKIRRSLRLIRRSPRKLLQPVLRR